MHDILPTKKQKQEKKSLYVCLSCIRPGRLPQSVLALEEDPSVDTDKQNSPNRKAKEVDEDLTKKIIIR